MEFTKERISTSLLTEDNYVSTENMLQDFQGVTCSHNVPKNTNVMEYKRGDVLVSNIRPYLKKVWMADKDGGCSADVFVMRANRNVCTDDFLHHIVANDRFVGYVMSGAKGVKMPRGDKEQMKGYETALPSLIEQQKVAHLLAIIDERIETQNRIIEELKLFRSAIYQRVFSSMHCETVALCKIADIIKGKQINGTELYDTGDYYVMNGGTVPSGYYDDYNTPANTISISEGGNSCGYVQFNDVPFWSGGHCYTLSISSSQIDLRYLFHYLKYREQDIMALRIGSGLPNIQKKNLERFQILIPTFDEQHRCSKIFDSLQHKEVVEASLLNKWQTQKQYLLRQMFI